MQTLFAARPLLVAALCSPLLLSTGCDDDADGAETSDTDASSSGSGSDASSTGGDGSSSGAAASTYADLAGDYIEPFPGGMTLHSLTPSGWSLDYGEGPIAQSVVQTDDDAGWVVLEDDAAGTFSRNDWTFDDAGLLRYCTAAFGAATAEDAVAADLSDTSDLDGVGCGGMFPWSTLEPAAD